jgi:arylsulfatase A-like enzyme
MPDRNQTRPTDESARVSRRRFLQYSAAGAAMMTLASEQSSLLADPAPRRKPNLVYVFADQLRYASCGHAGEALARTPNMQRLADSGCDFRQSVSCTPVCAPHRASLFTGKYQSSTGMVINELRLSPDHDCFGHALNRGGYKTAYIGKWHMWANQLGHHNETPNGFVPPGPYRLGFDGLYAGYNFNHTYHHAPYFRDRPQRDFWTRFEPDAQTDMALDFIDQSADASSPFALFLSWGPPHDPLTWNNCSSRYENEYRDREIPLPANYSDVPDPYADAWGTPPKNYRQHLPDMMRVYHAQNANLDYQLGRIMEALEKRGIADNTILVFTSDHGEMFGAHGRRAKLSFYEEAARIPFLIRWKDHIPAGIKSDACLNTPDIMPTLLAMMGLPVPKTAEGMDLSHLALGKTGAEPEAAYLQGMGAVADWSEGFEWRALRDHQFTYAIYRRDGKELLFDNLADPFQMKDLAGDKSHATKLAHYRSKLRAWMKEQNDTFEASSWYRDHWTDGRRNILRGAKGGSHDLDQLREILTKEFGPEIAATEFQPRS